MEKFSFIFDEEAGLTTIRDPMILVDGDTYYLTGTQPPYWDGANDGVRLWSSKDLHKWTSLGLIIRRSGLPESFWGIDRFWAPELFRTKNGTYILTFNSRNDSDAYRHGHGVGAAIADCVTGPYRIITTDEPLSAECGVCNDANIFEDDDGRIVIGFNAEHIPENSARKESKLLLSDLDPGSFRLSNTRTVCTCGSEGAWDHIGVEGQCLLKRNGKYIMWYSSWTRGYDAGILTADSLDGPWVKHPENPILSDNAVWRCAGHNHCFRTLDGKDCLIFHAAVSEGSADLNDGFSERMFIRPVRYLPDGRPVVDISD